jgi:hypothetical protein
MFNRKKNYKKQRFAIHQLINNKKKLTTIWNSISFHTFANENKEEKFELIATSLKKC